MILLKPIAECRPLGLNEYLYLREQRRAVLLKVLKQFIEWPSFTSGPIEEALSDGCGRIAGRRHTSASK